MEWYWWVLTVLVVLWSIGKIPTLLNWWKGVRCPFREHKPRMRYSGISVIGYVCDHCGYEWYEDRYR